MSSITKERHESKKKSLVGTTCKGHDHMNVKD